MMSLLELWVWSSVLSLSSKSPSGNGPFHTSMDFSVPLLFKSCSSYRIMPIVPSNRYCQGVPLLDMIDLWACCLLWQCGNVSVWWWPPLGLSFCSQWAHEPVSTVDWPVFRPTDRVKLPSFAASFCGLRLPHVMFFDRYIKRFDYPHHPASPLSRPGSHTPELRCVKSYHWRHSTCWLWLTSRSMSANLHHVWQPLYIGKSRWWCHLW